MQGKQAARNKASEAEETKEESNTSDAIATTNALKEEVARKAADSGGANRTR